MIEFIKSRAKAFGYAFSGWWHVIRTQRNAWIHALISVFVLVVGIWLKLPLKDWAFIVIAFALPDKRVNHFLNHFCGWKGQTEGSGSLESIL